MSTIAVIGTGNMGRAIAHRYAAAGHEVLLAGRDTAKAAKVAEEAGAGTTGTIKAVTPAVGITTAPMVVFAIWYDVAKELAAKYAGQLNGKILIDISNPLTATYDDLSTPWGTSAAEGIAAAVPGARVVKAFNTLFAPVLFNGALGDVPADVMVAGDDEAAKKSVLESLNGTGLRGLDAGPLTAARTLERLVVLQIGLQGRLDLGFNATFKFLPHA
jgi:8-hydroxy-5-deazaflavin:NADPH oxidoreductase